ncbi:histone-like nucleoid-structuring protein Lsr2 [Kitasatospora sp. CM 4170]|nr:histone-like nucleoid-structuring protein Lsr2 [Kitasatospora sp. CM 4170]WNM49917.1 histone-like nucleoid-structuring protein Lsr2 [Kitasatospora sp. CM 4170]
MGIELPREMRQWLLANDIDAGGRPERSTLVTLGCAGAIPGGGLLLGLTDIERVHAHMLAVEEMEPSGDPDHPSWRREWVPISSETDGFYGRFVDTRTGAVGSWSEGNLPSEGEHLSLSAFFRAVADQLETVFPGNAGEAGESAGRRVPDRSPKDEAIRVWARANGYVVHDRGRVPAVIREAYEEATGA